MNYFDVTARSQRILLWIALVLATLYSVAYVCLMDFYPPPPPTLNVDQVVGLYAHSNLRFRLGVALMLASGGFYFPWSLVVAIQMARDEPGVPIWALLQALSSTMCGMTFVLPAIFWGVAAFTVNRDPASTVLANEFAWLMFITPSSFFGFQVIPVIGVALNANKDKKNSAFPRWLGWLSLWVGLGGSLGAMAQVFKTGPFSWNSIFPFYLPLYLFFVWVAAMGYCMYRAIGRQEMAMRA